MDNGYTFQISGEKEAFDNLRVKEVSDLIPKSTYLSIPDKYPQRIKLMKFLEDGTWMWCAYNGNTILPESRITSSELVECSGLYKVIKYRG